VKYEKTANQVRDLMIFNLANKHAIKPYPSEEFTALKEALDSFCTRIRLRELGPLKQQLFVAECQLQAVVAELVQSNNHIDRQSIIRKCTLAGQKISNVNEGYK